jgi:hypothetical protein
VVKPGITPVAISLLAAGQQIIAAHFNITASFQIRSAWCTPAPSRLVSGQNAMQITRFIADLAGAAPEFAQFGVSPVAIQVLAGGVQRSPVDGNIVAGLLI